jgi:hypothetical protein
MILGTIFYDTLLSREAEYTSALESRSVLSSLNGTENSSDGHIGSCREAVWRLADNADTGGMQEADNGIAGRPEYQTPSVSRNGGRLHTSSTASSTSSTLGRYGIRNLLVRNLNPVRVPTATDMRPLRVHLRYTLRSPVE